jgi:hypothetical protein
MPVLARAPVLARSGRCYACDDDQAIVADILSTTGYAVLHNVLCVIGQRIGHASRVSGWRNPVRPKAEQNWCMSG